MSTYSAVQAVALSLVVLAATARPIAVATADTKVVAVVPPAGLQQPAAYGVERLRAALRQKGLEVTDGRGIAKAAFVVLAGSDCGGMAGGPESLSIRATRQSGKPAVSLCGGGARGLMYAALDTADRIRWSTDARNPFEHVRETSEKPFLAERGISMYTMHRGYFESRLHDERHWQRYFDMLAASRINSFVVIFGYENGGFMAPLYPYFFDVDGFPDVKMVGHTAAEQARNTAAFKSMIRIAHERGISVTAGIWDHIYRGGVQTGGIPGAPKSADARVPGLVTGVTGENLPAYTKAALRRFLQVFPEIDAIQFRMHEESGLTKQEMVSFWHEVFGLIKQARPDLKLDLRAKGLPDEVIDDALGQGLDARVSTKFWMEQLGLPFHPTHVNPQNQHDRRHGYADLLRYPQRYHVHWQVWSGGTTRLLLWGDPEYVRRFAGAARLYDGNSFEVNEMLATKMLGEPHGDKPIDILNAPYRYYDDEFERYWHFYQVWGRLTYDPNAPSEIWEREFARRFGSAAPHVMKALHLASGILPRIVASSYRYSYFPTTRGWAEMKRQDALPVFSTLEGSDTQQFMNPRDAARAILKDADTAMRTPNDTSTWFSETARAVLSEAAAAEKVAGSSKELQSTITDLRILAQLASYYAARLPAAVAYNLYKESGDTAAFDRALEHESRAVDAWAGIVRAAGDVYSDKLPFGAPGYFPRHWKEELHALQKDLEALKAARAGVPVRSTAGPERYRTSDGPPAPTITLLPVAPAVPGRDVVVSARVTAPAGVKSVRLRYRHVTQYEDYQTADMTLDSSAQTYTARIPASFVDPKWDLMYFVEVIDPNGTGRMFPDLDVETPYVIVPVARPQSTQQTGWQANPDVVARSAKQRPQFNWEEASVKPYELPDVLARKNGRVATRTDWAARRAEILEHFRAQVYGRRPGKPQQLRFETIEENPKAMAGAATLKRIAVHSGQDGRTHKFEVTIFLPNASKAPAPLFLLLNNRAATLTDPTRAERSEFWPAEQAIARGYGIAALQVGDLSPDDNDKFRDGVISLFEGTTTGPRPGDAWAGLAAWGWGASRAMDYFETDKRIDAKRVAVVGHSRGGKASLWTGAEDERFALVISNESGEGGAALARRNFGETLAQITKTFPRWFASNYASFAGREDALPIDQHMLLALVAPRAVYVASADEDLWADPRGEFLAVAHTSPVFALWGDKPIGLDEMPPLERPLVRGRRGYHVRRGGHNLTLYDWERFMDFADGLWGHAGK